MSEQTNKLNLFGLFGKVQESYQEAEARAKSEQGAPKIERFRTGEDGKYNIRVLPLAPVVDENGELLEMDRKGYEYPLKQLFLDIQIPGKGKGGKPKTINVPVINATQKGVGKSVDIIDTYVKIAKELYSDDKEVLDLLASNSFSHGLKWNSLRCMYVLDLDHRNKGPQLYQQSYSQYRDMDDAKLDLWDDLLEDNDQQPCPISAFKGAYPVTITRKNNNGKTEYKFAIKTTKASSNYDLTEEELQKLFDMPRINEVIYRYTKYQAEATLEFLKQYDERHQLEVTQEQDFLDAYKQLLGELPKDDTSSFDLSKADKSDKGDGDDKAEITYDDLCDRYDAIVDQDLPSDSDEYQELRADIAKFAKDNGLDLRVSHSKSNQDLLDELEDLLDEQETAPSKGKKVEKEDEPEPEPEPEPKKEEKPADEAPADGGRRRARRARPSDDDDEPENKEAEAQAPKDDDNEPENKEDEAPADAPEEGRRRRRERRPR
jgi:hypothetical protein